jgi:hypothetical protein
MFRIQTGLNLLLVIFLCSNGLMDISMAFDSFFRNVQVTATLLPVLKIIVPEDMLIWELQPSGIGTYTKKGILKVRANMPWKIRVHDADDVTAGHMTEWIGTCYGIKHLKNPIKISANNDVDLPDGGCIQEGENTAEQEVPVTFTQVISKDDLDSEDGLWNKGENHIFRIALQFEVDPII